MPPSSWMKIPERAKRRLLNAIPNRAYYAIMKMRRKEIVVLATQLGIPKDRLRKHFEKLRQEVPLRELGERMVADLQEAVELAKSTGLFNTPDSRARFRLNLMNRPLEEVIGEMREHAEAGQAGPHAAAA